MIIIILSRKKEERRSTDDKVFKALAAKNVRKSAKDYLIYFFTIASGVCLFYTFNSISTQFAMLQVEDRLNFLTFTSGMMAAISILVCAIIGVFSLVTGIATGIFASQGLFMITARIIGVSLENFHFMISPVAILGSTLFFAIIFSLFID